MTRLFFFFTLVWGLTLPGFAQTTSEIDASQLRSQPTSAPDTIKAIHALFALKRRRADLVTDVGISEGIAGSLVSLAGIAAINALSKLVSNRRPDQRTLVLYSLPLVSPGLVLSGLGILKRNRYSRRREAALLDAYQQGKSLPVSLVRRLKGRYFE